MSVNDRRTRSRGAAPGAVCRPRALSAGSTAAARGPRAADAPSTRRPGHTAAASARGPEMATSRRRILMMVLNSTRDPASGPDGCPVLPPAERRDPSGPFCLQLLPYLDRKTVTRLKSPAGAQDQSTLLVARATCRCSASALRCRGAVLGQPTCQRRAGGRVGALSALVTELRGPPRARRTNTPSTEPSLWRHQGDALHASLDARRHGLLARCRSEPELRAPAAQPARSPGGWVPSLLDHSRTAVSPLATLVRHRTLGSILKSSGFLRA